MIIKHHLNQLSYEGLLNLLFFQRFSKPVLINDNVPFVTTRYDFLCSETRQKTLAE